MAILGALENDITVIVRIAMNRNALIFGIRKMVIKSCPECGFSSLTKELNFETMSYFFFYMRCGYVEYNE